MSLRNMAKQLFLHDLSTTFRQCPPHVRRFHPLNKPHDFPHRISLRSSFSPKTKASFSSSSSSSKSNSKKKVGFVGWYLRKLETYPVITKSITSSLIFTAADLTSQWDNPYRVEFNPTQILICYPFRAIWVTLEMSIVLSMGGCVKNLTFDEMWLDMCL
ncbi:PXMP2/4 family protein 4-like [Trifolium pratense]|uniref:PXMP2/4 family protein 4-like n=1 Tax=Trifolium pratense TaxID=57577 RepID=A0A2K3L6G9_TRIPR|nr:PXMP2/4 family protein 4-like [Trifolium pratense]